MPNKILVVDLVGLTPEVLQRMPGVAGLFRNRGRCVNLTPPLPAVTCTSQATITTGSLPSAHGIVSNGWYFQETGEVRFWLRSDHLVAGEKIWEAARRQRANVKIANLFWRYCTHAACDVTVTERPTYWANGRKSPDVFASPGQLRNELVDKLGEFPLFRFWGPATSIESSQWIADATIHVLETEAPELAFTYIPHLDYDLQKFGPRSESADIAIAQVDVLTVRLVNQARKLGYEVALLSEYGITSVNKAVYPNRALREAGLIAVQDAQNGELLEPALCRAFAACSHQVAHVYVAEANDLKLARQTLEDLEGIAQVLDSESMRQAGLGHPRSGQLLAIAEPDAWLAYPYWFEESRAPDFARCVAIHDKPGHDPVEMFLGPGGKAKAIKRVLQSKAGMRVPFDVISTDASKIRGSHGRLPTSADEGPLLLTDWDAGIADSSLSMTVVKELLLNRLFR